MDKYCTNCGKELNVDADYCLNCGKRVLKKKTINQCKTPHNALSIAGMLFGIVAFIMIFIMDLEISELANIIEEEEFIIKIMVSLIGTMFSSIPAIIGLVLSLYGITKKKNTYATIGIITSMVSLSLVALTIIFVL